MRLLNVKLPTITYQGRDWEEGISKEYYLPLPPAIIGEQLRQLMPDQRINPQTVNKFGVLIGETYFLTKKQKCGKNCFAVSNQWAERIISRIGGRRPLAILDKLGITTPVRKHRATICPAPTVRQFVHGEFKPYRLTLAGKAARESRNAGQRGKLRREADPDYMWVERSLARVSLAPDDQAEYLDQPNHAGNAAKFGQGLRQQSQKGSYRWNSVCQMPAELRSRLRFDLESPVTRLDISCSFGIFLPWLFADEISSLTKKRLIDDEEQNRRLAECNLLRDFLSVGDFYDALADGRTRDEAKGAFQRYLNTTEPDALAQRIGRRFADTFPSVAAMIRRRRRKPPKHDGKPNPGKGATAFKELQGRQNEVIQAVVRMCRQDLIPCIPVWDELVVPFAHRMKVLNWLHEELYKWTGVRAEVGGIRMSAPVRKTVPCPSDLCPHCWERNIVTHLNTPFPCAHQDSKPDLYPSVFFLPMEQLSAQPKIVTSAPRSAQYETIGA